MLLRAFVCARNVRDGNDDGQVVEEEKFDVSGWAKSREKKIMRERGYFIYSKNSWNRERKFSWIFVNQKNFCLLYWKFGDVCSKLKKERIIERKKELLSKGRKKQEGNAQIK